MGKSIKMNASLNMIKIFIKLLFPLITIPYISRVLGVNNVGIYNFSASIVSYFVLIAQLGISTFAVREGAKYREDKVKMDKFSSEIFTINVISTIFSYVLLFLCLLFVPLLNDYKPFIMILSIELLLNTIGCEWIYSIYEEYGYIAIRTIIIQVISIIAMFVFVKSINDLNNYCLIMVISMAGANIINIFTLSKYCNLRFILSNNSKKYIIPILLLFINLIAITIYINSDITLLGIIKNDYYVGLYSISAKIYTTMKNILSALIVVSIPRLSFLIGNNRIDDFEKLSKKILDSLIAIILPAMVGIAFLSKDIILILSGKEYLPGALSLQILSVALVFSIFSWFYTSCILIPTKKDKDVLIATIIAAIINILLNIILIPFFAQNAAAFTTIVAEMLSFIICYNRSKKVINISIPIKNLFLSFIGCFGIIIYCTILSYLNLNLYICLLLKVIGSLFIYVFIELLLKNDTIIYFLQTVINYFNKLLKKA